jgi:hypothetical protein
LLLYGPGLRGLALCLLRPRYPVPYGREPCCLGLRGLGLRCLSLCCVDLCCLDLRFPGSRGSGRCDPHRGRPDPSRPGHRCSPARCSECRSPGGRHPGLRGPGLPGQRLRRQGICCRRLGCLRPRHRGLRSRPRPAGLCLGRHGAHLGPLQANDSSIVHPFDTITFDRTSDRTICFTGRVRHFRDTSNRCLRSDNETASVWSEPNI